MPYTLTIDEALHRTKDQQAKVETALRRAGAASIHIMSATRPHRTAAKFHGAVVATFAAVDRATAALQQIGTLKLGGWAQCWELVDASGTLVLLSPAEVAAINRPTGMASDSGTDDDTSEISRHVLWHTLMERQGYQCYVCGLSWEEQHVRHSQSFDMHRVVPGHAGGQYTLANTMMVCRPCHERVQDLTRAETDTIRDRLRA